MRIYIVRHGQSTSNVEQNHQGSKCTLTPLGIAQAKKVAKRVAKLPCEIIITSDYTRALETTKIIQEKLPKKVIVSRLLREERSPREIEGIHKDDQEAKRIVKLLRKNHNKRDWHFSDEENFFELKERAQKLLKFLEKRKEENILIVGHTMMLRLLAGIILLGDGLTPDLYYHNLRTKLILKNTGLSICEFVDKEWKVVTWNDHTHL